MQWATELRRVLKPTAHFSSISARRHRIRCCRTSCVLKLRELFVLQNTIHWIKAISIDDERDGDDVARAFQADQFARDF